MFDDISGQTINRNDFCDYLIKHHFIAEKFGHYINLAKQKGITVVDCRNEQRLRRKMKEGRVKI